MVLLWGLCWRWYKKGRTLFAPTYWQANRTTEGVRPYDTLLAVGTDTLGRLREWTN